MNLKDKIKRAVESAQDELADATNRLGNQNEICVSIGDLAKLSERLEDEA